MLPSPRIPVGTLPRTDPLLYVPTYYHSGTVYVVPSAYPRRVTALAAAVIHLQHHKE